MTFDDHAVQAVVSSAIGLPYLATLLSHRAALVAINQGLTTVHAADVEAANDEAAQAFRGRVSRRTQIQIDDQVGKGELAPLGALAGAAQTAGGPFTREDISVMHASQTTVEAARLLVDRLAASHVLFEADDEEFGRTYKFIEDTAPAYLWLLSVEARALGGGEAGILRRAN